MSTIMKSAFGLIALCVVMTCGSSAAGEESASIRLEDIHAVLGTPVFDHKLPASTDGARRQLAYRDEALLLISIPHNLRISGITLLIVGGQLQRVAPSYYGMGVGSLSLDSDLVQAIATGFRIPARSLHNDEEGRIRPSRLWRLIREAVEAENVIIESAE